MNQHRKSLWKTTSLALISSLAFITIAQLSAHFLVSSGLWKTILTASGWLLAAPAILTVAGGLIVLKRDADQQAGKPDLFPQLNAPRSESALLNGTSRLFRWPRLSRAWSPRVGDLVEIRSLEEIRRTLDASESIDGLPFQAEMAKFCGRRARVYRGVDKIYDYGRTKTLRRLNETVLLVGLRCDGAAHDGCQAACYLMWKTAWLKPVRHPGASASPALSRPHAAAGSQSAAAGRDRNACYRCQFTELASASTPMHDWDLRQDVRPLLSGNVTLAAFAVFALTRFFNFVQGLRGGVRFPVFAPACRATTPVADLRLAPGDTARVLSADEIAETLNPRSRNRGLWFDIDMLKNVRQSYKVLQRVERIIDDATGRMVEMKTPCIVLDGVDCTGEFLRLSAQHDYTYWREAWLARDEEAKQPAGTARQAAPVPEADARAMVSSDV